MQHWEYCYERSIGCVGVLKDWLAQTLSAVLETTEKAPTITLKNLEQLARPVRGCLTLLKAAQKGEKKLRDTQEELDELQAAIGLDKRSILSNTQATVSDQNRPDSAPNSQKKRKQVGKPNPKRYEVGGSSE